MGAPKKVDDWALFDTLCELQCTQEEFAAVFKCDIDTINNSCKREFDQTFSEYFAQKRGNGKVALRRAQYRTAIDGNVSMLIWLGKNWLGQTEPQAVAPDKPKEEASIADVYNLLGKVAGLK